MLPGTYREDDSIGIKRDVLRDSLIESEDYKHRLQDVYVEFDSMADDDEGVWTDDERSEIRLMQKTVKALIDSTDENIDDIREELEDL